MKTIKKQKFSISNLLLDVHLFGCVVVHHAMQDVVGVTVDAILKLIFCYLDLKVQKHLKVIKLAIGLHCHCNKYWPLMQFKFMEVQQLKIQGFLEKVFGKFCIWKGL